MPEATGTRRRRGHKSPVPVQRAETATRVAERARRRPGLTAPLPTRLSEFDVQQSFCLSADDLAAVAERFRYDRWVAAAIQMLFLRASGRPMDRFASVPKRLLRSVCEAFQTSAVSIASLRSLYARRQTLHEHQAWARTYLGLQGLDAAGVDPLQRVLAIPALEAAHPEDLAETARMWLFERRIVIPGPRRLADLARERPSMPPRRPWQP